MAAKDEHQFGTLFRHRSLSSQVEKIFSKIASILGPVHSALNTAYPQIVLLFF